VLKIIDESSSFVEGSQKTINEDSSSLIHKDIHENDKKYEILAKTGG